MTYFEDRNPRKTQLALSSFFNKPNLAVHEKIYRKPFQCFLFPWYSDFNGIYTYNCQNCPCAVML